MRFHRLRSAAGLRRAGCGLTSSGCNPCGGVGWGYGGYGHARLADPEQQYYYVNQGPTYSGPGAWAPARVYQEDAVSGYGYGNGYGYGVTASVPACAMVPVTVMAPVTATAPVTPMRGGMRYGGGYRGGARFGRY